MSLHDALIAAHAWNGHINAAGLYVIQQSEGYSASVYRCPADRWTIGYGSTWDIHGAAIKKDQPDITKDEGEALLRRELAHVENSVRTLIKVPLNENQFSAVCSLAYNIGTGNLQSSTLRSKLNRMDYSGASDEFPKWRRASGKIMRGLVKRRAIEQELFNA